MEISTFQITKDTGLNNGMINNWIKEYRKKDTNERRWFNYKLHEVTQIKYEIIKLLSKEYNIKSLCLVMKVSRSGYYKLIKDIHNRKPSYVLQYKNPIEYRTQLGFNESF